MSRFSTKKWINVHDQSGGTYNASKQTRFESFMLRSNLCNYSHAALLSKELLLHQGQIIKKEKIET